MTDLICPYGATLVQKMDYACPHADEVIRRGGSEYVCMHPGQYRACSEVHAEVKKAYLANEGLDDDLLTLPHSTYVKIQFGCVQGLAATLGRDTSKIDDIGSLIADAIAHFKNSNALPFASLNETISSYRLQKRGKRK